MSMKNKTVLITGASKGIGKAIGEAFVSQGAIVYGTTRNSESISEIESSGMKGVVADICERDSMEELIRIVKKHME